ncbi:MAG TPA: nitrite reductase (NAD(P)H), partial [Crenotrichaceae bacterium]|nr:nitrite reductase (NAD(P)H) [Crenotrichaceae bacterium]
MIKKKLVVIGNGMVGHHFLEAMVNSSVAQRYQISTFCEEPRLAYDRVHLSEFFSGKTADDLALAKPAFYQQHGIAVYLGDQATRIDRQRKIVTSEKGVEIEYDVLVLATGSYPFVPPIAGHDREHCFVYRTIEDLEMMESSAQSATTGVVVGGGLLGLEAANALKGLGLQTHVVEFAPRLMAVQLDEDGGKILRKKIEAIGVEVHTGKNTTLIDDGQSARHRMHFADGEMLETDMILFSAGIRPRDNLAQDCDLEVGARGGIVINDQCQTSDENIYAIGECALWNEQIFGLVAPGYQMARVVSDQLSGINSVFTGADMSTKLKLLGVDVGSIGDAHARTKGARSYVYQNELDEVYKRLIVSEDGKHVLGAVLVGDNAAYNDIFQYYLNDIELPEHPEGLILPHQDDSIGGL